MEQKMAQGAGLTTRQEQFLAVVLREKYLLDNFYLSGGTALSSWYLHHRESFDLDFFSDQPFDSEKLERWVQESKEKIGYQSVRYDEDFGFDTFILHFENGEHLIVDFNHYTNARLKKGIKWQGLEIDSLYDIAVNKTQTIKMHPRARDYIDFYLIHKKTGWNVNRLLKDTQKKFFVSADDLQLAKNFLKVSEYRDFPKMLVPFNQRDMDKFYVDLAGALKSRIFKN